jgi:hypothetical protein
METPFQTDPAKQSQTGRSAGRRILLPLIVLLAGVTFYFLLFRSSGKNAGSSVQVDFGSREQAYAPNIHLGNFKMQEATNFLNQDVKILQGDILNVGDRPVLAISAAIEFRDWNDKLALQETRPLLPPSPGGLKPAQTAHFELSFDRVPRSWNYQMPVVRVNGLKLIENNK